MKKIIYFLALITLASPCFCTPPKESGLHSYNRDELRQKFFKKPNTDGWRRAACKNWAQKKEELRKAQEELRKAQEERRNELEDRINTIIAQGYDDFSILFPYEQDSLLKEWQESHEKNIPCKPTLEIFYSRLEVYVEKQKQQAQALISEDFQPLSLNDEPPLEEVFKSTYDLFAETGSDQESLLPEPTSATLYKIYLNRVTEPEPSLLTTNAPSLQATPAYRALNNDYFQTIKDTPEISFPS